MIVITSHASTAVHKPPSKLVNFPGLVLLASNAAGYLSQVILHYVSLDVSAIPEQACSIHHQLSCRRVKPAATTTYWFWELCKHVGHFSSLTHDFVMNTVFVYLVIIFLNFILVFYSMTSSVALQMLNFCSNYSEYLTKILNGQLLIKVRQMYREHN